MIVILESVNSTQATVIVALRSDKFQLTTINAERRAGSQLLNILDQALKKNKQAISKIKGIGVVAGPGGFAAVRSAVAMANAIGYARQIPVVAIKLGEYKDYDELVAKAWGKLAKRSTFRPVMPIYDGEPNIGVKKAK